MRVLSFEAMDARPVGDRDPAAKPGDDRASVPVRARGRGFVTAAASTRPLEPVDAPCPSCGADGLLVFYEQERVPLHSCRLLTQRDEAERFGVGALRLGLCPACGFVTNTTFHAELLDYSKDYEETQGFSPRFRAYLERLALRLVETYGIRHKDVLEIGCGKGDFLALLCALGCNRGVGVDPGIVPERLAGLVGDQVTLVAEAYSEQHSHLVGDLVACRHTLEHIQPVREFVELVRRTLAGRSDVVTFFEVPDVVRVLRTGAFWDVYYEHCSYFSPGSLARLFRSAGFELLDLALDYDEQYVVVECRPAGQARARRSFPIEELPERIVELARQFRDSVERSRVHWSGLLADASRQRRKVVLWGSGSKAVGFLTSLGIGESVRHVVDINPHKQGMYLPVTAQQIVPPDFLADYGPDIVIAMNPTYKAEIATELGRMGVRAQLLAV